MLGLGCLAAPADQVNEIYLKFVELVLVLCFFGMGVGQRLDPVAGTAESFFGEGRAAGKFIEQA